MPTDPITDVQASDNLETLRTTTNTNHDRRFWMNVVEKTADYTVAAGEDCILVDVPAATTVTISLPDGAAENSGRMILVVARTVGASGQLDVDCTDVSDTVNDAASVSKTAAGHWLFMSDGTDDWMVVASA